LQWSPEGGHFAIGAIEAGSPSADWNPIQVDDGGALSVSEVMQKRERPRNAAVILLYLCCPLSHPPPN